MQALSNGNFSPTRSSAARNASGNGDFFFINKSQFNWRSWNDLRGISLLSAGDDFCKKVRNPSAVAMLRISSVRAYRLDRAYRLNREDPNISGSPDVFVDA